MVVEHENKCIPYLSRLFNIPQGTLQQAVNYGSTPTQTEIALRSTILTNPSTYRAIFNFPTPPLEDLLKKRVTVFVHVPKTAGTSIHRVVRHITNDGVTETFTNIQAFPLFYINSKSWIFGHIDRETALTIFKSRRPLFITLLRDPLERYKSLYYFWRSHDPQKTPLRHVQLAVELTPQEFFSHPHIRESLWNEGVKLVVGMKTYNLIKKYLFTPPSTLTQKFKRLLITIYAYFVIIKALFGYKLIGFQEDLPSFVEDLYKFTETSTRIDQIPRENITKIPKPDFSDETKHLIESMARLEIFMYKAARIIAPYKRLRLQVSSLIKSLPQRLKKR